MRTLDSRSRREEIVNLATTSGLASVEELCERFNVTASTIRRDLALLTSQGKLARTYGGAMALVAHPEASLRQRTGEAFEAKWAIARHAAGLASPGESLLLDAGSTVATMAHELRTAKNLQVTTVSMAVVQELGDVPGVDVQCLGGRLRPLSQAFIGPLTEAALERMTFDRAFMSADGVSATEGICEADLVQTRLKELMARRAEKVYILAHSAKIGARPFHAWARLERPWTLITDEGVPGSEVEAFRAAGIEVVVVGVEARRPL